MGNIKIKFIDGETLYLEDEVIVKISEIKYVDCNEAVSWQQLENNHVIIRKMT